MFPYHHKAHSRGSACLRTTEIPSLWIFGSHQGLGGMCQTEVTPEHGMTLPRRPCALICHLSWDKAYLAWVSVMQEVVCFSGLRSIPLSETSYRGTWASLLQNQKSTHVPLSLVEMFVNSYIHWYVPGSGPMVPKISFSPPLENTVIYSYLKGWYICISVSFYFLLKYKSSGESQMTKFLTCVGSHCSVG